MSQTIPILPLLLLALSVPLGAQTPAPADKGVRAIPQPVLLDWGGQFRLNSPPNNADEARMKKAAAAAEERRSLHQEEAAASSGAASTLGPDDLTRTIRTTRPIASDDNRLNVVAPVKAGPVSVGASYGKYRAIPVSPAREVEADDMRVSLGIAF